MDQRKIIKKAFLGFPWAMLSVFLVYILYFEVITPKSPPIGVDYDLYMDFTNKGNRVLPNVDVEVAARRSGEDVYRIQMKTDRYGRRVVPLNQGDSRSKHLIMLGCSLTMGEGVEGDETMPFYLSQELKSHQPYVYALGGWGIQNLFVEFSERQLDKEIVQAEGVAVYTAFFGECCGHIRRFLGSPSIFWVNQLPQLEQDESGEIKFVGKFKIHREWKKELVFLLRKLAAFKQINVPDEIEKAHVRKYLQVILKVKKMYLEKFPDQRFVVALHPWTTSVGRTRFFLEQAKDVNLEVIDLRSLISEEEKKTFTMADDWHPTPEAHRKIAMKLAEEIRKMSQ